MIRSFSCRETQRLFENGTAPRFASIQLTATRKLDMLDKAKDLLDLQSPPGNQLETLKGNRTGQHSIRINSKWRICFVWSSLGPMEVEIVDYH